MQYFLAELKQVRGSGEWLPGNCIQAKSAREAINLAQKLLRSMFDRKAVPMRFHRVRRVSHEQYLQAASELITKYDESGQWMTRLEELETNQQTAAVFVRVK